MTFSILDRLGKNRAAFAGKKIVVVGDIAWDRTFRCRERQDVIHSKHANEKNLDLEIGGDDQGSVGGAFNICQVCRSFGVDTSLMTAVGSDEEGTKVKQFLTQHEQANNCLTIEGNRTVTRLRFFDFDATSNEYDLLFRVNQEPDYSPSEVQAGELITRDEHIGWFRKEIESSDALLISDTDKGFLSSQVLGVLGKEIEKVNSQREKKGRGHLLVVVDPKNNWEKFFHIPVDVLKPNHVDALRQVNLVTTDVGTSTGLRTLAESVYKRYGDHFQKVVITLGAWGAALIEVGHGEARLMSFPQVKATPTQFEVATHCGDVFAAALVLGLTIETDLPTIVTFSNCVASLQYALVTGNKVTMEHVLKDENVSHLRTNLRPALEFPPIPDKKEMIVREILQNVQERIDYRTALYSWRGRRSDLIAGGKFSQRLNSLGDAIQPGNIVFICGESGVGKGALLDNMAVFLDGYEKERDYRAAIDILVSEDELDAAIAKAEERRTCLILDEIQAPPEFYLTRLLTRFPNRPFQGKFCLILAGHLKDGDAFSDLTARSVQFEIPPYRDDSRRYDLPFLIGWMLRKGRGILNRPNAITGTALHELLRCDFNSPKYQNVRALSSILMKSCASLTGETLTWKDLNFEINGVQKPTEEPSIPDLSYEIEIVE